MLESVSKSSDEIKKAFADLCSDLGPVVQSVVSLRSSLVVKSKFNI